MTFYLLALSVCLAVWFLAMAAASVLEQPLSRMLRSRVNRGDLDPSPGATANALFILRTSSLWVALLVTLSLALPAFLRLEPHAAGETISLKLWLCAAAGTVLLVAMLVRGTRVLLATRRIAKFWSSIAKPLEVTIAGKPIRLYAVESTAPLLAVTGFFRPRIFVAREVSRILTASEFHAAVAHELDHVRRFDNLKQFVLKIIERPGWLGGSRDFSWTQASEVAADAGALDHGASALELAAALVKIAALKRGPVLSDQIAVSHLLPDLPGSPLEARVMRLQKILESDSPFRKPRSRRPWRTAALVALPVLLYVSAVSAVLPAVHEALEFLVR